MTDLVAFCRARLDEDEAAAKAAIEADGADWVLDATEDDDKRSIRHVTPEWDYYVADRIAMGTAAHMARHDPARVLREVAAKRAILALLDANGEFGFPIGAATLQHVVQVLAAVYSGHPDYRAEWKP